MSKYTVQLRYICETLGQDEVESWFKDYRLEDYLTPKEIELIEQNGVWNKDKLARKIVRHYFMREIGCETVALFKMYAKNTMEEIMEDKLPLIYSKAIEYDPLINVNYKEVFSSTEKGDASSESKSQSSGLGVNSDTPQGQIDKTEILKGKYATTTGASENEGNDATKSQSQSSQEWTRQKIGNDGVLATAQKMVEQYRDNVKAIDREIIDEVNKLFMGIY